MDGRCLFGSDIPEFNRRTIGKFGETPVRLAERGIKTVLRFISRPARVVTEFPRFGVSWFRAPAGNLIFLAEPWNVQWKHWSGLSYTFHVKNTKMR